MKKGDFIRIEYEARILNTGMLFDTTKPELAKQNGISEAEGPETIIVGERYVITGLDEELEKRKVGEEFTVNIPPEKAFGNRRSEMIKTFPMQMFRKEKINPLPGLIINLQGISGKILSASGGRVRVDFNHVLAGKAVQYKARIIGKVTKEEEKTEAILKARLRIKPEVRKTGEEIIITTEKEIPKQVQDIIKPELEKYVKTRIKYEHKTTKPEKN